MSYPHQPAIGVRALGAEAVRRGKDAIGDGVVPAFHVDGDELPMMVSLDEMSDVSLINLIAEASGPPRRAYGLVSSSPINHLSNAFTHTWHFTTTGHFHHAYAVWCCPSAKYSGGGCEVGGFEPVMRFKVGEPAFHGVVEEPGDGLSVAGLLADDFSEGL